MGGGDVRGGGGGVRWVGMGGWWCTLCAGLEGGGGGGGGEGEWVAVYMGKYMDSFDKALLLALHSLSLLPTPPHPLPPRYPPRPSCPTPALSSTLPPPPPPLPLKSRAPAPTWTPPSPCDRRGTRSRRGWTPTSDASDAWSIWMTRMPMSSWPPRGPSRASPTPDTVRS